MTPPTDEERAREIVYGLPLWKMIDDEADAAVVEGVIKGVAAALASARREGIEEAAKAVQEIGMCRLAEAAVGVRRSRGPRIGEIAARIRALATPAQEDGAAPA